MISTFSNTEIKVFNKNDENSLTTASRVHSLKSKVCKWWVGTRTTMFRIFPLLLVQGHVLVSLSGASLKCKLVPKTDHSSYIFTFSSLLVGLQLALFIKNALRLPERQKLFEFGVGLSGGRSLSPPPFATGNILQREPLPRRRIIL